MIKTCLICKESFDGTFLRKTCSKNCRMEHARNRRVNRTLKTFNCRFCFKTVNRINIKSGFCSISCSSKFYCKNGVYNKWINSVDRNKKGFYVKCMVCNVNVYNTKGKLRKYCSTKCLYKDLPNLISGEKSALYGKKEKPSSKKKRIKTLMKKYGVSNAFQLGNFKNISKAQKEIYTKLSEDFPGINFKLEDAISSFDKIYKVDILIEKLKIIIEYNGDYWHCNPKFYNENYQMKNKKKTAKQIWDYDYNKQQFLKSKSYDVIIVWEDYFLENKKEIFLKLKRIIDEKNKSINAGRSSVGSVTNLADVKLGELLEVPKI